jgi:hypothetical protein
MPASALHAQLSGKPASVGQQRMIEKNY